jgi:DNA-binding transcriptional regulator LsrR (DeoR family)
MSQEEVINILEKFNKPLSRTEIATTLNISVIRVSHALKRLTKSREVKIIELTREQAAEHYGACHKRRMRLYYY